MTDDQKALARALTVADLPLDPDGTMALRPGVRITSAEAFLRSLREGRAAAVDADAFFALLSPQPADASADSDSA